MTTLVNTVYGVLVPPPVCTMQIVVTSSLRVVVLNQKY